MIIHEETENLIVVVSDLEKLFEAITFPLVGHQIKEQDPRVRRITLSYDQTIPEAVAEARQILEATSIPIVLIHNHLPGWLKMGEYCPVPYLHDEKKSGYFGIEGIRWWCEEQLNTQT